MMHKQDFCIGLGKVSSNLLGAMSHDEQVFTPEGSSSYGYTGEIEDENGFVYLRARYYSHELGEFLSLDPHEGDIGNPMSLNGYAYAHGNPINNTDPSGRRICSDAGSGESALYTCVDQVNDLRTNFGIRLGEEEGLSERLQPLSNWTTQRVASLYAAVQAINRSLGGNTRRAIGDTEIRLLSQGSGRAAAVTTRCDLISLYLNFVGASDHVHTVDNLIHEFGHIVTLSPPTGRVANSEARGPANDMQNRPVALWEQIKIYRGMGVEDGWSIINRQSESSDAAEVVPDMFLYWVQGYPFTTDEDNFGQARNAFMGGGDIPRSDGEPLHWITEEGSTYNDGSVMNSAGIQSWAANASCPSSEIQESRFDNNPDVMFAKIANDGWCSF